MKKTIYNLLTMTALSLLVFTGCVKDKDEPDNPAPPTTTGGTSSYDFKWTPSAGTTMTADDAWYSTSTNNIYASKTGTTNSVEIILPEFAVATYSISSAIGNELNLRYNSTLHSASSGTVKITANNGSVISGQFAVNFNSGTISSLTGQFTDIPKK